MTSIFFLKIFFFRKLLFLFCEIRKENLKRFIIEFLGIFILYLNWETWKIMKIWWDFTNLLGLLIYYLLMGNFWWHVSPGWSFDAKCLKIENSKVCLCTYMNTFQRKLWHTKIHLWLKTMQGFQSTNSYFNSNHQISVPILVIPEFKIRFCSSMIEIGECCLILKIIVQYECTCLTNNHHLFF
jgi:hypothetical protein